MAKEIQQKKSFKQWAIIAIAVNVIIALSAMGDAFQHLSPSFKWLFILLSVGSMAVAFMAYKKVEHKVANRALIILAAFALLMIWLISSSLYLGS